MNLDVLLRNAFTRFPDHPAVIDSARTFSFRQVDDRISRLGHSLLALGLNHQSRIASLQFNSTETLEFDLMSGRFGFVRTLLNARYAIDDLVYVLNHCKARLLCFGHEFEAEVFQIRDRLPLVQHYVCVGDAAPPWALSYDELIAKGPAGPVPYDVAETDWHSIYYTSGTTGRPKGVVLSQRNWLVLVRNHFAEVFPRASESDVLLHAAPMSHASGAMIIAHMLRGSRQVIMPRFEAGGVLEHIARFGATTMFLAPTMAVMLLEHPDHDRTAKETLHSVVYSGGPMAPERIREALRRWGPVLIQGYGQWEAPQFFTCLNQHHHAAALAGSHPHRLASCGLPFSFARVGIMSKDGTLLPVGNEGEVVTAGDHLMVGYLDDPDATSAERHGIWQRTGDIGRFDEDGFLYLTDRKKDLIITGGSNVYPREIEDVLAAHPNVVEAIVVGVPDDKWGERVHAVVVQRNGAGLEQGTFLSWCRERLSADKRPRSMELVDELPKSAYGKILRREVRARFWKSADRQI